MILPPSCGWVELSKSEVSRVNKQVASPPMPPLAYRRNVRYSGPLPFQRGPHPDSLACATSQTIELGSQGVARGIAVSLPHCQDALHIWCV